MLVQSKLQSITDHTKGWAETPTIQKNTADSKSPLKLIDYNYFCQAIILCYEWNKTLFTYERAAVLNLIGALIFISYYYL